MLNTAFTPWPNYTEEEADAVRQVLLSNKVNYWTGNECQMFEMEFAHWAGTEYAVALANGTVALDAALKALEVGQGDEVIVTPRSFLASASCIVLAGASPIFADIDANTQNITADTIKRVLTKKTKAIICVHLSGWPCDMDPILELAKIHQLFVIEDCAQAHGARYKGKSVGSLGDIAAWSFCQDKIMTTGGEGGMITTNDPLLKAKIWSYKDHGKSLEAVNKAKSASGFQLVHEHFGTNLRMTEIQATIGRIQLKRMSSWHDKRLKNAFEIWEFARQIPGLRVPLIPSFIEHGAYKCYIFVELNKLAPNWDRNRIMLSIREKGVPCYMGSSSEIYLEKAFDNTPWRPRERLATAIELGETSLMFLIHPTLTSEEIAKTCLVLKQVMQIAVAT